MNKVNYWLLFILNLLMIISGIYAICTPDETILSVALLIGIIMLAHGISMIWGYFSIFRYTAFSSGFLFEGLASFALGLFVIMNYNFTSQFLPYVMAMWMFLGGVERASLGDALSKFQISGAKWLVVFGIILSVFGVFCFFRPLVGKFAVGVVVGVLISLYGLAGMLLWYYLGKAKEKLQKIKETIIPM